MVGIKCCKDCVPPMRHIGCHATCPEYASERAKMDAAHEARKRDYQYEGAVIEPHMRRKWKYLRRRIGNGGYRRN